MTFRERILRAGAAITGGLSLALEHLTQRDQPEAAPVPAVDLHVVDGTLCPLCDRPLDGLHVHGGDACWSTEHEGVALVTRLDGSDALVIPDERHGSGAA